jgi:hypothetical protein
LQSSVVASSSGVGWSALLVSAGTSEPFEVDEGVSGASGDFGSIRKKRRLNEGSGGHASKDGLTGANPPSGGDLSMCWFFAVEYSQENAYIAKHRDSQDYLSRSSRVMATMVPDLPVDNAPYAEREVHHWLRDGLPDAYHVFHSLPLLYATETSGLRPGEAEWAPRRS